MGYILHVCAALAKRKRSIKYHEAQRKKIKIYSFLVRLTQLLYNNCQFVKFSSRNKVFVWLILLKQKTNKQKHRNGRKSCRMESPLSA